MKVADTLSTIPRAELQSVLEKSDFAGFLGVSFNWLLIISTFGLVYFITTWWSWIMASCLLAGRQLGLAILMHDCAHGGTELCELPLRTSSTSHRAASSAQALS